MTRMSKPLLQITGEVEQPVELTFDDLCSFPEEDQQRDVSRFHPQRQGDGLTLLSVLNRAKPKPTATHVTLHGTLDSFSASVPLKAVEKIGILVYQSEGKPLSADAGGPIRFLIPNSAPCKTAELDACANVKFVDHIELTAGKGRNSRVD